MFLSELSQAQAENVWQIYGGNWVRWTGRVYEVEPKVRPSRVIFRYDLPDGEGWWLFQTRFTVIVEFGTSWSERLRQLSIGETVGYEAQLVRRETQVWTLTPGLDFETKGILVFQKGELVEVLTLPPEVPPVARTTLEVANASRADVAELTKVVGDVVSKATLIANEQEKNLLGRAHILLQAVQPDTALRDLVANKTPEERLVLDALGIAFAEGLKYWAKTFHGVDVPSQVGRAIAKGAEELGKQIGEWVWMGELRLVKVTMPGSGVINVAYDERVGEIWASVELHNASGAVYMYIPVEPILRTPEGGGNIVLSEGVRPVMEKVRIAYKLAR